MHKLNYKTLYESDFCPIFYLKKLAQYGKESESNNKNFIGVCASKFLTTLTSVVML